MPGNFFDQWDEGPRRGVTPGNPYAPQKERTGIRQGEASADSSEASANETNTLLPGKKEKGDAEAIVAAINANIANANQGVDQKIKKEANDLFTLAYGMGSDINEIEQRFKEGPGATSGVAGIVDFNPFATRNARMTAASDKLRGFIKNTQGFTGGEGNTVAEMKMNVGAFIPSPYDRDAVSRDNIEALKRERRRGMKSAISTLRGIPDQNGLVTPIPQGYTFGQYPDLDDAVVKAMQRVPPTARGKFMLEAKKRYEAEKRSTSKRPSVRIIGDAP